MNSQYINLNIFKHLNKVFAKNGVTLSMDLYNKNRLPYIGHAIINANEGFYVKSSSYIDWTEEEKEKIKNLFPLYVDNHTLKFGSISDCDHDEDRLWEPSISFFLEKTN